MRPVGEVATAIEKKDAVVLSKLHSVGAATANHCKASSENAKVCTACSEDSPADAPASDVLAETADVLKFGSFRPMPQIG